MKTDTTTDALMPTEDFITELFVRVDEPMAGVGRDPRANLWPGELVTVGLLFAIKGVGERAFDRWLRRDWLKLFPATPERTRLSRLPANHRAWADRSLADPTIFGVIDGFGIELIHPAREGRGVDRQGRKGLSNHRWIDGGKLGAVLNGRGEVVAWDAAVAGAYDGKAFRHPVERFDGRMIVLADNGLHQSAAGGGDPPNLKLCKRKTWGGTHRRRDVLLDADGRLPLQTPDAPGVAVLRDAARVHDGGVQRDDRLGRAGRRRGRQVPPVDRPVQPMTD